MATPPSEGRRIHVGGIVQGVGFRPWVFRLAGAVGVAGRVENHSDGVTVDAFGGPDALEAFVSRLAREAPPAARVEWIDCEPIPFEALTSFSIGSSRVTGVRRVPIPADLATCPDCAAEIAEVGDRRFRYAFTTCTNCGPRFTIACGVPYDRGSTTMASFRMCPTCQSEHETAADRRFHAVTNACPACGPRLVLVSAEGKSLECADPIRAAAQAIEAGSIVAVKSLGGFQLSCTAASNVAVRRLRERKRREEKPFAVMVRDLAAARMLAEIDAPSEVLLVSVERPIVLVPRREPSVLAPDVAPHNPLVGLYLPFSPLHQLLLADTSHPLVMTSGNLSEEPLAIDNREALDRLRDVADLFLLHDRDIAAPCDDSVARVIAGAPVVLRRARGYVPRPIPLRTPVERPVLACGAHLKNTFCLAEGDRAYLGPHVGNLENLATVQFFEEAIERLETFTGIHPDVIAHDRHPAYESTRYARSRSGVLHVGVQHHHAHVASAMAEHRLDGPVIGVAYDGTGYGDDGTAWGGEVLCAEAGGFERLATFRPVPLAGGETAIRHPWRIALALVLDAFGGDAPLDRLSLFRSVGDRQVSQVRRLVEARVASPLAHGVGRYFDGFGALGLGRPDARYEGQVALEWNLVADPAVRSRYGFAIDQGALPWVVDLRGAVRGAVGDLLHGTGAATVSARFHNTLTAATAEVVRLAVARVGKRPVVLTGGCFQNARLTEGVLDELASDVDVLCHHAVPPGDGGVALGQVIVADATVRAGLCPEIGPLG